MNNYKNTISLTYLRSFSILMIVIGHLCHAYQISNIAWYIGYTFVNVFLILSALLIGLRYKPRLHWKDFYKKRVMKLNYIYYPYLLIAIFLILITKKPVSINSILTHIVYTNWFIGEPLCGVSFGHLWYLSIIMVCYIIIWTIYSSPLLSMIVNQFTIFPISKNVAKGGKKKLVKLFGIIIGLLISMYILTRIHIPSRIPLIIFIFVYFYYNAEPILAFIKDISLKKVSTIFLFANIITIIAFTNYKLDNHYIIRDCLTMACAILWIFIFYKYEGKLKYNALVFFIASISFEIYLVHHPLILGEYSIVYKYPPFISIFLIFIITFSLAYILSLVGKYINLLLNKSCCKS